MPDKKELLLIEIREDGARVVKRRIDDIGDAGDSTTNQMNKLKTVLGGLISAKVLKDTILLADAYANMLNRLRVVTKGTYELHAAMEAVFQMSRETRTSLEANIDMYNRIAINTKQMGLEMQDVVRFATQLNHAIILSGVTAREAQWGMVQFSQGLAAGALRGDELRAVMEQLPIVTETLTKYLGIGRGELRKWAFEGRVTTQVIIDAFNAAEKSLAERFGRRIPTVDQALTVLRNSMTKFVGDMDQAIQGTGSLSQAILWASDNMDFLGRVIIIAGTALGSIFLKNLIQVVAQMKLFSLTILKVHPLASALLLAGTAAAVFSDKIKIANDSSTTLADTFKALAERGKETYKILREGLSSVLSGEKLHTEYQVTFQSIIMDAGVFIDKFLGLFVGAGQVISKVLGDIPNNAKRMWNVLVDGVEGIMDHIIALFKTLGDMFRIFALNVKAGMIALSGAVEQALAGNAKQAKFFADQAALSFKNAATSGFSNFGDILRRNIESEVGTSVLGGAKLKVEKSGETLGEAFMRGFNMSTLVEGGLTDLFDRADEIAAARGAGAPSGEAGAAIFSPTPTQSELLKDMLGDIGKVNNEMQQLQELWKAINTQQPGTEGMDVTLEQVNRKMTELRIKALETNTDVMSGFQRGFMQLGLELSNFADMAEKTITNAFQSMEDALVSFVTTGKVDFKSLVDSMLADLTRLLARQAIMGLLNSMSGGGGILGSLASAGSAAMSGGGTAAGGGAADAARAMGGPVSPGMSYLVGERGQPEIFTPSQPGHITPTSQAAAAAGEAGNVVIINVASEEEAQAAAAAYLESGEGDRIIRNKVRTYSSGSKL